VPGGGLLTTKRNKFSHLLKKKFQNALNLIFKHTRQIRKQAIHEIFGKVFADAEMTCIVENLFEDDEWAFLMRSNPLELCGYVFFHIKNGKIQFQSRY
jgi:hypothetical protein